MPRPSDYTEQLTQILTDDLIELRQCINRADGGKANIIIDRMQGRLESFDHTFGPRSWTRARGPLRCSRLGGCVPHGVVFNATETFPEAVPSGCARAGDLHGCALPAARQWEVLACRSRCRAHPQPGRFAFPTWDGICFVRKQCRAKPDRFQICSRDAGTDRRIPLS